MSTPDDQPPSKVQVKRIIRKLTNKHELSDYIRHLVFYDDEQRLIEEAKRLKEALLLQGLDEDDLFDIYEFLQIKFDGDIMKIFNKAVTEKKTKELEKYLQ